NVMPLPVMAIGFDDAAPPAYVTSTILGSLALPDPTPRMPPKPPRFSSAFVHTLTLRPAVLAMDCASPARNSGVASSDGVLTRSRAQFDAPAKVWPRFRAAFTERCPPFDEPSASATTRFSSDAFPESSSIGRCLYFVNEYAPSVMPSAMAW